MTLPTSFEPRTLELQLRAIYAQEMIDRLWLHKANVEVMQDIMRDILIVRLSGYMLADQLADTTEEVMYHFRAFPASWWQHTKMVHFPTLSRWIRRPPRLEKDVRRVMVNVATYATFPKAKIPYPEGLGPIRIMQSHRTWVEESDGQPG